MSTPIPLGPFVLESHIADGGMGAVYAGRHVDQNVPVAIKVVTGKKKRSERYYRAFLREVRAVARLAHPNIVTVFDYGLLPPHAETLSDGQLRSGSPFLVMEYAGGGALSRRFAPLTWGQLHPILTTLLDGLAHAHARGMVHRDLKPANALLTVDPDGVTRLKLSDFGLAQTARATTRRSGTLDSTRDRPVGTPHYMAPEQFRGAWREFGPWTDLYSLGIMAFELATGTTPFRGDNVWEIGFLHAREPLPEFTCGPEYPPAFAAWIERLCAKDPYKRFQRAADASLALGTLGPTPEPEPLKSRSAQLKTSDGHALEDTQSAMHDATGELTLAASTGHTLTIVEPAAGELVISPIASMTASARRTRAADGNGVEFSAPTGDAVAPVAGTGRTGRVSLIDPMAQTSPPGWSLPERSPRPPFLERGLDAPTHDLSPQLAGAGLGLFGLRTVPLVGRDTERAAIWGTLGAVHRERGARALILRGPGGVGKSRLAEWACLRAHELGIAHVMRATHDAVAGPTHGLARMLAHFFNVVDLGPRDTRKRLQAQLQRMGADEAYEWRSLTEVVMGGERPDSAEIRRRGDSIRFNSPRERYVALARTIARVGHRRTVVLWLDDCQWGPDALAFCAHVLEHHPETPVLFLVTWNDASDASGPMSESVLQTVRESGALELPVGPLSDSEMTTLVGRLLGLVPALTRRIVDQVRGNPLFAVQLVGDWVQRRALQVTPDGFDLKPGEQVVLPASVTEVWTDHIRRVLADFPDSARRALELAAVLGREMTPRELEVALNELDLALPDDLLNALMTHRLVLPTDDGWAFAHATVRDTLVKAAWDEGTVIALHAACARVLERHFAGRVAGVTRRVANHLIGARDFSRALEKLAEAAREHLAASEFPEAITLLEQREALVERMGLDDDSPLPCQGWVLRAQVHRAQWDVDGCERYASAALDLAVRRNWPLLATRARAELVHVARQRGELDRAEALADEALDGFLGASDNQGLASMMLALAIIHRTRGGVHRAIELYKRARSVTDDPEAQAKCLQGLANAHMQAADHATAERYLERAREAFQQLGNTHETALCINGLAEVARYRGDYEAAETGYRDALRMLSAVGSDSALIIPQLNLGLTLLRQHRLDDAANVFRRSLFTLEMNGQRGFLAWVHANLLPCVAHGGDEAGWQHQVKTAGELLGDTGFCDRDIAESAEMAAGIWAERGRAPREAEALRMALDQWTRLGQRERTARVRARLDMLTS